MAATLNDLRYQYYATALGIPLTQAIQQSLNDLEYQAILSGALTPSGGAPSGPAGGALSGTYPNPGLAPVVATAQLNNFSNTLKGTVPASGGGTANFMRADGSWVTPNFTVTAIKSSVYSPQPNEFVLFDTTSGALSIPLPTTPPNGTQVGGRIVTQASSNGVTFTSSGGDVFNKPGGPTSGGGLTLLNQAIVLEYFNGVWTALATGLPLNLLDTRYGYPLPTLVQGPGIEILPPSGGTQIIQVATASKALWDNLYAVKAADLPRNTTTTATADPDLQVALAANSSYWGTFVFKYDADINLDFKYNFTCTGATIDVYPYQLRFDWTTGLMTQSTPQPATSGLNQSAGAVATGTIMFARGDIVVQTVQANPIILNWAQVASGAINTILKAGSAMKFEKML